MPLKQVGAILLILLLVVVCGNLWFHFVEAILGWIKNLFNRHKEPPAWHPLPSEEKDRHKG